MRDCVAPELGVISAGVTLESGCGMIAARCCIEPRRAGAEDAGARVSLRSYNMSTSVECTGIEFLSLRADRVCCDVAYDVIELRNRRQLQLRVTCNTSSMVNQHSCRIATYEDGTKDSHKHDFPIVVIAAIVRLVC